MKPKKSRGFMLILSLLVGILILLVCGGMVYRRSRQYQAANDTVNAAAALALAEAGLEDARVKLDKDDDFPPLGALDQHIFAYVETVVDLDGTTPVGSYEVIVDTRWQAAPCQIVRLTSIGSLGDSRSPRARRSVTVELDVAPKLRSDPLVDNPNYYKFISREGP